jgi:hypothetical protein
MRQDAIACNGGELKCTSRVSTSRCPDSPAQPVTAEIDRAGTPPRPHPLKPLDLDGWIQTLHRKKEIE